MKFNNKNQGHLCSIEFVKCNFMKNLFAILFLFSWSITIGQVSILNKFYNKQGYLLVDTTFKLNKYNHRKPILKDEEATINKLLDSISYPQILLKNGISGSMLLCIDFYKGQATKIRCLPFGNRHSGAFCDKIRTDNILTLFKLNQLKIKTVCIPLYFTTNITRGEQYIPQLYIPELYKKVKETYLEIHEDIIPIRDTTKINDNGLYKKVGDKQSLIIK